ncbi:MAG: tsaB [Sphingobacteriaceae bacterium]|jgi:tRNA threonylcarbamoyladenosine biosynthesis protein TsaB|nr:tsaB [Sphingobacteriaceae bacterium]
MPLILQIETATTSCSVTLALDGEVVALKELTERNIHASHITLFIEEVMAAAGKSLKELDAVAVSMGPGSYTGLRIGVSTAKGLCYALEIPLIAVNTLEAMASAKASQLNPPKFYCPMIDARRMEVYLAVYDPDLNPIVPVQAKIIDADSFSDLLKQHQIVFFGDGAEKCREVLTHPNAEVISSFENSAAHLTALALKKYESSAFEDVAYFEPFYLKDFIALPKKSLI